MSAVLKEQRGYELCTDKNFVGPWVCKRVGGVFSPVDSTAIGLLKDGTLIAGVLYDSFNRSSIRMHVAGEGMWAKPWFVKTCFDYPFNKLGVKKVIGLVDETNMAARRFDEHLGFVLEATIKDAAPKGDLMIYTMTREQCRFLGE